MVVDGAAGRERWRHVDRDGRGHAGVHRAEGARDHLSGHRTRPQGRRRCPVDRQAGRNGVADRHASLWPGPGVRDRDRVGERGPEGRRRRPALGDRERREGQNPCGLDAAVLVTHGVRGVDATDGLRATEDPHVHRCAADAADPAVAVRRNGQHAAPVERRGRIASGREAHRDRLVGIGRIRIRQWARRDGDGIDRAVGSEIHSEVPDRPVPVVAGAEVLVLDDDLLLRGRRVQVRELRAEGDAVALPVRRVLGIQIAVDVGVRGVRAGRRNELRRALIEGNRRRRRRTCVRLCVDADEREPGERAVVDRENERHDGDQNSTTTATHLMPPRYVAS